MAGHSRFTSMTRVRGITWALLVVKAESDREFLIIDGQQRIATLTILGLAIINGLHELAKVTDGPSNEERANALRARYIGEKDPASLTEISKLVLNEHDKGFFQDYLVQLRMPRNPRDRCRSRIVCFSNAFNTSNARFGHPNFRLRGKRWLGFCSRSSQDDRCSS